MLSTVLRQIFASFLHRLLFICNNCIDFPHSVYMGGHNQTPYNFQANILYAYDYLLYLTPGYRIGR